MVKSVLIGKVVFDEMMMLDALRLQLTDAVRDEQEMLLPPDINWLALLSMYEEVVAAWLFILKVRLVDWL